MRFGEPQWLWLLLLLPALAVLTIWAARRRERDLARWCHPALWARLIPDRDRWSFFWRGGLVLLAAFSLALMAARPQLGSRILSVKRKGIDVMIALDTSESMLAEDLAPNRITRARQAVQSLIDRLRGDRVGLIAFSGEAFVECPLTLDYSAARMFLRFMDTDLIPVPGTAIAEAIKAADRSFDEKERKFKALVLITDGEDHEGNVEDAAKEAKEHGVRIFAVGVGTSKGEPIPERTASGGVRDYKRDREGNVVLTKLDPATLREICEETGGRYYDAGSGNLALDRLYSDISGMEQKEMKGGIITQYEDRYGYFAAAALFFLMLEFVLPDRRRRIPARGLKGGLHNGAARGIAGRAGRGVLKAAPVLFIGIPASLLLSLVLAVPALAGDPGGRHYRKGEYPAARDEYEKYAREHPKDPRGDYDLGTALHQTGEMSPAQETLRRALRTKDPKLREAAFYNLGNTCARAGDLAGARDAYRMALRLSPKDLDAKHNLELVEELLKPQPPDSSKQNRNDKNQQNQDRNQKSGQSKDQDKQQDQKDKQQQEQQQGQQQQQQQQQQNQQQQKQREQDAHQQDGQKDQDKDAQGRPLAPMKISPEQARQILEGLAQQEMLLQAERLKAKSRDLRVEKDW
jgi:Ca-activated chloride channel family protein